MTMANGSTSRARSHSGTVSGHGGMSTPTQIWPIEEPSAAMA
jgi:hypothetical protein